MSLCLTVQRVNDVGWLRVAVYSTHASIFRTAVSTAARTDSEKRPRAISACARVRTAASAFMRPARECEARAEGIFVNG